MSYQRLIHTISDLSVSPKPAPYIQRIIAWFFPTYANKWKWHRQKQGGRWARIFKKHRVGMYQDGIWKFESWEQLPRCPYILYDGNVSTISECTKEQCNCEVYSSSGV